MIKSEISDCKLHGIKRCGAGIDPCCSPSVPIVKEHLYDVTTFVHYYFFSHHAVAHANYP